MAARRHVRSKPERTRTARPAEVSDEEKLRRANLPKELSAKYHPFYEGKVEIVPKVPIRGHEDFAIWYTPGVAEPCLQIKADPSKVWQLTNKWNNVAIVTDGTRVLGLGDIGPEAGLPVMDGKSLLFKYLGGVDAYPIPVATKEPEEIIQFVKWLTPAFGGVNLEDIAQPKCFGILERLRKETDIAVWHDDQQGTATINVAGVFSALKVVGKKLPNVTIALVDSKGIICRHRSDIAEKKGEFREKWELAQITNSEDREGGIPEAMKGTDVVIAASKPGPGVIQKEWVRSMADDAILFVIANPTPEIWPWEAKEAGARIVATGRSDFPNQVNNSICFPAIFRGTLDVSFPMISDEMCIAAANELAKIAEEMGIDDDKILPSMSDWEVFPREAAAVGAEAVKQGTAGLKLTRKELYQRATTIISHARKSTELLMRRGLIKPLPGKTVGRRTKRRIE